MARLYSYRFKCFLVTKNVSAIIYFMDEPICSPNGPIISTSPHANNKLLFTSHDTIAYI